MLARDVIQQVAQHVTSGRQRQLEYARLVGAGRRVVVSAGDYDRVSAVQCAIAVEVHVDGPIRQAGFHTLENASGQWSVGANLFAASETLLNNHDATDTSQPLNRGRPLSLILALIASWLLLIECILYHRRKVG